MNKLKAFTLAEMLVVMGMIGVIAALTIPNLNEDALSTEYVAKFKKTEAAVQNALGLVKIKYGDDVSSWGDSTAVAQKIYNNLNWSESCGLAVDNMCFSKSDISAISGSTTMDGIGKSETAFKIVLKDNVSLAFDVETDETTGAYNGLKIYADLDGSKKGYNTMGQDIFIFKINDSGMISYDAIDANTVSTCRSTPSDGDKCSAWVHRTGNNDYINCSTVTLANPACD